MAINSTRAELANNNCLIRLGADWSPAMRTLKGAFLDGLGRRLFPDDWKPATQPELRAFMYEKTGDAAYYDVTLEEQLGSGGA